MRLLLALWLVAGCAQSRPAEEMEGYTLVNAREPQPVVTGPTRCEMPCSLVHVDGFDNSLEEAKANFATVASEYRRAGGRCQVFGFAWRSDVGLRRFSVAETLADEVGGPALARFLRSLHTRCDPQPVHVMGHSLAARVIMRALVPEERVRVDTVTLVAPAIFDDAIAVDGEFSRSVAQIGHTYVLYNTADHVVLGSIFPMASRRFRWPLGLHGNRGQVAPSVTEVDFGPEWGIVHSVRKSLGPSLWRYLLPRTERYL